MNNDTPTPEAMKDPAPFPALIVSKDMFDKDPREIERLRKKYPNIKFLKSKVPKTWDFMMLQVTDEKLPSYEQSTQ